MKKIDISTIELDPETIAVLSDNQSEEVEGGKTSCNITTCGTKEV
jgi:hypothetical protein